jgi:hypothetical protein
MNLTRLYEFHAEDCARAAEQTDNSNHRAMLIKLAAEWRQAVQARRQSMQQPSADEKKNTNPAPPEYTKNASRRRAG